MRLIFTLLICCILLAGKATSQLVISELHYDNTGTDVNEKIEIFGVGGTNLSGYRIYLYAENGKTYRNISLSGIIPNMVQKFGSFYVGVISIDVPDIRNGKGAIALVNNITDNDNDQNDRGDVWDFICYGGGNITAKDGPADGQIANNIGVSEDESTAANASLWRPSAATENFSGPAVSTFGVVNTGLVPITIREFNVSLKDKIVDIKWTAINTHPDSYYEVERSTDQRSFERLTKIKANGTGEFTYSFRDLKPVKGNAYYRLRLIDPEIAEARYSHMSRIKYTDKSLFVNNVFPTRSRNNIQLQINSDKRYSAVLEIIDYSGKLVRKTTLQINEGNRNYPIPVASLAAGSYLIRINTGVEMMTAKFIRE